MKRSLSIKLDENLWIFIKNKPNKSAYLQELIKQDLQGQQVKPIVQAVITELLVNEFFFYELRTRLANSITNGITVPVKQNTKKLIPRPPDPLTGYPCCAKATPCKHWKWNELDNVWVNELTNQVRDVA